MQAIHHVWLAQGVAPGDLDVRKQGVSDDMIIEPDQHYYREGTYEWTQERSAAAWDESYRRLEALLGSGDYRRLVLLIGPPGCGKSTYAAEHDGPDVVLFDGLFALPERRARALALAARHGVPVEAVWVRTDLAVCLERNGRRSPDRRVPEEAVRQAHQVLEETPPTCAEGFVAVRVIEANL